MAAALHQKSHLSTAPFRSLDAETGASFPGEGVATSGSSFVGLEFVRSAISCTASVRVVSPPSLSIARLVMLIRLRYYLHMTEGKDPAAVELGRRGGKKGGKACAAKMTTEERCESARKAAKARWDKKRRAEESS